MEMSDKKPQTQKLWEIDLELAQRIKKWKVEERAPNFAADSPEIIVVDGHDVRRYIKKPYWVEGRGSDLEFFQPTKSFELCLSLVQDFSDQSEDHAAMFVQMLKAELEEKLERTTTELDLIQSSGRMRCLALINAFMEITNNPQKKDEDDHKERRFKCSSCAEVITFKGAKTPTRACPKCDKKKVDWEELPPV